MKLNPIYQTPPLPKKPTPISSSPSHKTDPILFNSSSKKLTPILQTPFPKPPKKPALPELPRALTPNSPTPSHKTKPLTLNPTLHNTNHPDQFPIIP